MTASTSHISSSEAGADVFGFPTEESPGVLSSFRRAGPQTHERAPSLSNADLGVCKALMGKKGR